MVTNMGKDLEGGVRQRIHVQEGLCGLGGVPGYKEDARDVRSEKNCVVKVLAVFNYLQDEQTSLGVTVVH